MFDLTVSNFFVNPFRETSLFLFPRQIDDVICELHIVVTYILKCSHFVAKYVIFVCIWRLLMVLVCVYH